MRGDQTRSGSIIAQRFNDDGSKVGGEVVVDTKGINFVNESPTVTGLANGGFVVTWEASANIGPDTNDSSIDVQYFDANGNKVGPMLVANTATDNYQKFPVVTELDNGFLAVVWTDNSTLNGDAEPASIKMQIYDPNGKRFGGEILVNTSTEEYQQFPSVVALSGGRVMVSWTDQSGVNDPQDDGIVRQIFSVGGATTPNARGEAQSRGEPDRHGWLGDARRLGVGHSGRRDFVGWRAQLHGDGWQYQRRCDRLVVRQSDGQAGARLRR